MDWKRPPVIGAITGLALGALAIAGFWLGFWASGLPLEGVSWGELLAGAVVLAAAAGFLAGLAFEISLSSSEARRQVFSYDVVVIGLLVVIAILYFTPVQGQPFWSPRSWIPDVLHGLLLRCIWLGALGGMVISLKGVYDHDLSDWKPRYNLWHLGRPISGTIAGGVTYLILIAVSANVPQTAVVMAAAFIMGTQERRFFNLLYEVARLIVTVPGENVDSFGIVRVEPNSAAPGRTVAILGQGFSAGARAYFGGFLLDGISVSPDGTTITGTVPAGPAAGAKVNVLVVNADSTARFLAEGFTYPPVP